MEWSDDMTKYQDSLLTDNESPRHTNRKKSINSKTVVVVLLWCVLVFGGFYIGKVYLDKALHDIQQTNAMNIKNLDERIGTLTSEVQELKAILSNTDQVISNSGVLQADLNFKIQMLDQQLQDLQKSLQTLKEAP